jgi:hypothetical protein
MGLNTFLWSFPATYPAIAFCAEELREALRTRGRAGRVRR